MKWSLSSNLPPRRNWSVSELLISAFLFPFILKTAFFFLNSQRGQKLQYVVFPLLLSLEIQKHSWCSTEEISFLRGFLVEWKFRNLISSLSQTITFPSEKFSFFSFPECSKRKREKIAKSPLGLGFIDLIGWFHYGLSSEEGRTGSSALRSVDPRITQVL